MEKNEIFEEKKCDKIKCSLWPKDYDLLFELIKNMSIRIRKNDLKVINRLNIHKVALTP